MYDDGASSSWRRWSPFHPFEECDFPDLVISVPVCSTGVVPQPR